ncbi:1,5-anhydro-D-fructose reductase-like [Gigantopelta aegis]|uniref:1,5-anhydro-D-fructose reductase-like n=1 Tax=Gigantopelta aegis TaxID=1735272 RepID=UPI001B88A762|nr:1,5-anhydro-D-fructose reductase-like [Gigantopelta aegis]
MANTVTLNNGHKMPVIGLGTWQATPEQTHRAVKIALEVGYRHVDTAFAYGNEEAIGAALQEHFKEGKLKREDVFITTKLWMTHMKKDDVPINLSESLRRLKLDYVDLYLVHAPMGFKNRGDWTIFPADEHGKSELESVNLIETWRAMEDLLDSGKVRAIGVSNFNSEQIDLIVQAARHQPVTNQVECNAYFPQEKLEEFCEKRNIRLTAYSPLGSPGRPGHLINEGSRVLLEETTLQDIGRKYGKTPAQVLLRNLIQRGIFVIPKSTSPQRIKENFEVFDFTLTEDDMNKIRQLQTNERMLKFHFAADHPEYPFNIPY